MSAAGETTALRRVAIVAGSGTLPREVADSIIRRGGSVHILAIDGAADADFRDLPHDRISLGSLGAAFDAIRRSGARDVLIIGGLKRPDLWRLKPDLGFLRHLPEIVRMVGSGGDDSVLRKVIGLFDSEGLRVIGLADAAPELFAADGVLAGAGPQGTSEADITLGMEIVSALAPFDIGQAAIVSGGRVLAIEGAEGTDRMLARAPSRNAGGGVLVKRAKAGQDRRVDLPAIGPVTIINVADAGLAGIAVEAGSVVIAERERTLARALERGVFIHGVADIAGRSAERPATPEMLVQPLRSRSLPPGVAADALKGLALASHAARFGIGASAVVSRGHVLALAATEESAVTVVRRTGDLRQWGSSGGRRRRGVAVLREPPHDPAEVVVAAIDAGLAALVLELAPGRSADLPDALVDKAQAAGLVLATAHPAADLMPREVAAARAADARPLRLVLIAGEHSGDALGGKLMAAIRDKADREVTWIGVGGEDMERHGLASLFPLSDVAVMGPIAILKRLPQLVKRVHQAVDAAVAADPDVVVVIDSPEFTHPIAKRIRKQLPGVPIIDYVSPSVWAWRPGRARRMRAYVDHVLALLPFEPEAHRRLGGPPCTYVGHPLVERIDWLRSLDPAPLAQRLGLDPARPVLVVLPGSRPSEVSRLMQPFGDALALLAEPGGAAPQVVIPAVPSVRAMIEKQLSTWTIPVHLVEGDEDKFLAFRLARAALAASGTVTLELSLAGTPMVVAYRVEAIAARLRFLLKVQSIVLPNLVLGENAFPEYIQEDCTPALLSSALRPLLSDTPERRLQLSALDRIPGIMRSSIASPSAAAADVVLSHVKTLT